ncbi:MAG: hypothetical protein ACC660_05565 [Acidimicrobiales bacterium]
MKKVLIALTATLILLVAVVAPAGAHSKQDDRDDDERETDEPERERDDDREEVKRDRAKVVREWNAKGTAAPGTEVIGRSKLKRSEDGLKAKVKVEGLIPGGVYTFWWVSPQVDTPASAADVFVARGAAVVVGRNGKVKVKMRAYTGQAGIEGFPPLDGGSFAALTDPLGSVVRVEIAYHGQASDAGADLGTWMSDFWTGQACPPETPNPNPAQPHCPVYFAATHSS